MALHLTQPLKGFKPGLTRITTVDEVDDPSGIGLSVLKLDVGERFDQTLARETAFLLMEGVVQARAGEKTALLARKSLFDEPPSAVHASAGTRVELTAQASCELTVYETANARPFPPALYTQVADEHRGKGQLKNAAYRLVRTVFDSRNAPPQAELVLGEVVTLPGRWSSYPPHHHPQPELYHYRFTDPRGYGHAELGEVVLKVRHNDTVKILGAVDHPQCAAPGYGMYYAWVIRHLPGARYDVPEFTADHAWAQDPKATHWWPTGAEES